MTCDPIDNCGATCIACGTTWCRDADVSPGEADDVCRGCYETEDPEDSE